MGCILYELTVGTRAFSSDWAVMQYKLGGKDIEIDLDETFCGEFGLGHITRNIMRMLQIDPLSRPSATDLFKNFSGLCRSLKDLAREIEMSEKDNTGLRIQSTSTEATTNNMEERGIEAIIKRWKDAGLWW